MFKDDMHWHTVDKFSREFKTNKKFSTTWPARFLDLIVTENVCLAVKLKLHIETDVIKVRAELANAECRIWKFIEYIQNLYASISDKYTFSNSRIIFFYIY